MADPVQETSTSEECQLGVSSSIFLEFLEVAVHVILASRQLYPEASFKLVNKYNLPVEVCEHPEVQEYVTEVVTSIRPLLAKSQVESVCVVVMSSEQQPLEKFVFDVSLSPVPHSANVTGVLTDVQNALRSLLIKLRLSPALLHDPLAGGAARERTWAVQVHTRRQHLPDLQQQGMEWMEAEERETRVTESRLVPLRAVHLDIMKVQLYVEEGS